MVTESEISFPALRLRTTSQLRIGCPYSAASHFQPFPFRAAGLCFLLSVLFSILGPMEIPRNETTIWTRGTDSTNVTARDHRCQYGVRLGTATFLFDRAPVVNHRVPPSLPSPVTLRAFYFAFTSSLRVNTPADDDDDESRNNWIKPSCGEGASQGLPPSP
ncbi:hypothetical protein MPH_13632 [Macrophomina phaseolina MS6]|uniref:Uncharacterized protein n=1 Tax=Macrophomina phaseolina (strain MS6) TaxID=1126212 RepID=K2R538_MACPH|nr:hypothetical protein MPH_13632 [Macrophomina phaseolina MS6]